MSHTPTNASDRKNIQLFFKNQETLMSGPLALWALKNVFFEDHSIWQDQSMNVYLKISDVVVNQHGQTVKDIPKESVELQSFYKAVSLGLEDLSSLPTLSVFEHKLRQLGVGLKFEGKPKSEEGFQEILQKFGCNETIAKSLKNNLVQNGFMVTTVQYKLKQDIPSLRKELKKINISIQQTLPSFLLSEQTMDTKLKQLVKQYK